MENHDGSNETENQPPEAARVYVEKQGLIATFEANVPKQKKKGQDATTETTRAATVYRREGFDGIVTVPEIERRIGDFLRAARENRGLAQYDLAPLLGITGQVWGRYERSISSLDVSRLIVICEILDLAPEELLGQVAPHLYGDTEKAASDRIELFKRIADLPDDVCSNLLEMVKQMENWRKGISG